MPVISFMVYGHLLFVLWPDGKATVSPVLRVIT